MHFLYDLAYSPKEEISGGSDRNPWTTFSKSETSGNEIRTGFWNICGGLSEEILLILSDLEDCPEARATTGISAEEYTRITITVRKSIVEALKASIKTHGSHGKRVLYRQFDLAVILCHEVALCGGHSFHIPTDLVCH